MSRSIQFFLTKDKAKYIHYEVIKNVVPVTTVFIHGNMSSNRWWYPMLDAVRKESFSACESDIILAEIRGCGQSSEVESSEVISIPGLANEFLSFVSELRLNDFNLVGHSTGGSIAYMMLTKIANEGGRAVLIDPVGPRGRRFSLPIITAFQNMKFDRELVESVMRATVRSPCLDPQFFNDVVMVGAIAAVQVMAPKIAEAFGQFNCVEILSQIQSSVLVLHGDQDQVLPIVDSQELAKLIPRATFEVLSGMGHCPNLEDPQRLWNRVSSFLYPE